MEKLSILLVIGSAIVISLWAGKTSRLFHLPMVIGYVIIGVLLGRSFLNIFNPGLVSNMGIINDLALGIIAFIIGGELKFNRLKALGKMIVVIALFESLGAFFVITIASYLLVKKVYIALILGAVGCATAPAATVAVINQYRARGPLTTTVLGVVGSDDAIALIVYAFVSAISLPFIVPHTFSTLSMFINPIKQIFLSLLIGSGLGLGLSYLLNRIRSKEESFALVIGALLIGEGIAIQFDLSELLLVMTMAIIVSNLASHRFHPVMDSLSIAGFPIIAAFFCLAGTKLNIRLLPQIGWLGLVYLLSRLIGKFLGARLGACISGAPLNVRKYIGLCLWPQIGVAVALAIMVERDFVYLGVAGQNLATLVINILLFTTIFTEIIGPLATKFALVHAEEIKRN